MPEDAAAAQSVRANLMMNQHLTAVGLGVLDYDDLEPVVDLLEEWAMNEVPPSRRPSAFILLLRGGLHEGCVR